MDLTRSLVFDIETQPLPEDVLTSGGLLPEITAPANYKDPDKIAAYIAEKRVQVIEEGALEALTGSVCAIGWTRNGRPTEIMISEKVTEKDLLESFWTEWRLAQTSGGKLVGFNIKPFDLPFLIRRSWAHKVAVPMIFVDRYFLGTAVWDIRETWQLGDRSASGNLDRIARHLGVGVKNGDGKFFWKLLKEDPEKAREYLRNDVQITYGVAERLL